MYKRICTAALVFGAAAIAPPVEAQNLRCLPRETLVETLQANYGEALTGGGLVSPQRILEVWSSEDSGREDGASRSGAVGPGSAAGAPRPAISGFSPSWAWGPLRAPK